MSNNLIRLCKFVVDNYINWVVAFVLLFCSANSYAQSPNVLWAVRATGADVDEGNGIAIDKQGNSVVTGYFKSDSICFGSVTLRYRGDSGKENMFVAKYDPHGNVVWAKSAAGAAYGKGIAVDAYGNSYITGSFSSDTITFGTFSLLHSAATSWVNLLDLFVVKYDSSGNVVWAKKAGGTGMDEGNAITTDSIGNIYLTGRCGPFSVFDTTTLSCSCSGCSLCFLAKYDTNGNLIWARTSTSPLDAQAVGNGVAVDHAGNSYIIGSFAGDTVMFDSHVVSSSRSFYYEVFIAMYDAAGNGLWVKKGTGYGGGNNEGRSIDVDTAGNVYFAGHFQSDSISFEALTLLNRRANWQDLFFGKCDAGGNIIWAKRGGGEGFDLANCIKVDKWGGIYLTGYCEGDSLSFGDTTFLTGFPTLKYGMYVSKLNVSGNLDWIKLVPGSMIGNSLATDASGSCILTGRYSDTVSVGTTTLICSGLVDLFVVKLSNVLNISDVTCLDKSIAVFPNPTKSIIKVILASNTSGKQYILNNITGQVVLSGECTSDVTVIDLSELPPGIYILNLGEGSRQIFKILKLS